jgi:3-hydroxyisobutyrate dehydrogenase-like beta-hydroxyacid dehydrogenase
LNIGIVGLGLMGTQIARKMLAAGHEVIVWNRTSDAMNDIIAAGAKRAHDVAEALSADIIVSTLFDDDAIRRVLMTNDGLPKTTANSVHVCMSTVTVAFGRELQSFHLDHKLAYVAAPMMGRPDVVSKGGLNILAAGSASLLDQVEQPLACLGKIWRVGLSPVDAQVAKLAANFMISGALEAMAEATALLQVHGVDAERFLSIMTETLFSAFIYKSYGPLVAGRLPPVASGLALPIKDNLSFLEAAKGTGIKTPLGEIIRANLAKALELGGDDDDWSTGLATVARGSAQPTRFQ